jgi:hypothetical protein
MVMTDELAILHLEMIGELMDVRGRSSYEALNLAVSRAASAISMRRIRVWRSGCKRTRDQKMQLGVEVWWLSGTAR